MKILNGILYISDWVYEMIIAIWVVIKLLRENSLHEVMLGKDEILESKEFDEWAEMMLVVKYRVMFGVLFYSLIYTLIRIIL